MEKIKILQVNKLYYPETGGIERTVQNIAEGLSEKTDMKVLVCQRKGKRDLETINNVPIYRAHSFGTFFSMPLSLDFILQLRRMAKNQSIIHFHMPFPLGDIACLLSGYRGKVVVYWHSDVVKQKRFMMLYRPVMELFLKRSDLIMVGAQGIIEGSKYLRPYKDKCKVVPFAVSRDIQWDGENYLNQCTAGEFKKDEEAGKTKFLFVGRLVYYKGCDLLIQAMKDVKYGELTIVGSGEMEKSLKELAVAQGVQERVHFLGQITDDEIRQSFRDTDVFILPSIARSEAFGLVQLEAMAYGKPVINTNLPSGVPDVSLDGITGLTVEPGNVDALAKAMNWMVEHPEERKAYGVAAKKRIDAVFTLDKMLQQIYGVYEELLIR